MRRCEDDHGPAGPAHPSLRHHRNRQRKLEDQDQKRQEHDALNHHSGWVSFQCRLTPDRAEGLAEAVAEAVPLRLAPVR